MLFLFIQRLLDVSLTLQQLGIGVPHHTRERCDNFVEKNLFNTQSITVTHGAANNPSQDVSATFIGRSHSVNDKKGTGADVVGDHPQGIVLQISRSGYLRYVAD